MAHVDGEQRHHRRAPRLPGRRWRRRSVQLLSLVAAAPGFNKVAPEIDGMGNMELELESRALKASVVLDPAALVGVEVPNGLSKVTLRVAVPGKTIVAEVNAKSLRRTVAAIAAAGPNGVAVVLQGKLEDEDRLTEAGIAAQPKTPKPPPAKLTRQNRHRRPSQFHHPPQRGCHGKDPLQSCRA